MKVLVPGHKYVLDTLDGDKHIQIDFVNRCHEEDEAGTTNQDVLRVLIDRVKFLNNELPWYGNKEIISHLRYALLLHEIRHMERLLDRGEIKPEIVEIGEDGHYLLGLK